MHCVIRRYIIGFSIPPCLLFMFIYETSLYRIQTQFPKWWIKKSCHVTVFFSFPSNIVFLCDCILYEMAYHRQLNMSRIHIKEYINLRKHKDNCHKHVYFHYAHRYGHNSHNFYIGFPFVCHISSSLTFATLFVLMMARKKRLALQTKGDLFICFF